MKYTFRILVLIAVALAITGSRLSLRAVSPSPSDPCSTSGSNPVACENTLPGNPASEWDVTGGGDPSIQGFATDISVNRGDTVHFKIDTPATAYRLDIYRLGYYGGNGARKVATVLPSVTLPQNQPDCLTDASTGLIDCGNWQESASWAVPSTAVSGVYVARLTRTDTGGASHIVFIVRDDSSHSALFFQTSDTTWQAYNEYGGNSLYVGGPGTNPGRAYKVSYNRPFTTRETAPEDWLFNAEYPMIRWLEQNGYDVSYTTGVDTDRRGSLLLQHQAFLSVGHDEYWSGGQRANVEAARAAGVNLAFFSGNEVFWKTRWEPSIDGTSTDHRTLVSYKETHANAKIDPLPDVWTGTWRDPRFSPPADGGRPENALTGTLFMVNSGATTAIEVPAEYGKFRFWRNTSIASMTPGTIATLAPNTLGYEWDEAPAADAPEHLIRLSSTTVDTSSSKLLDYGSNYGAGTATHSLTLYRDATSGALVFGAGTVQWSWGLDPNHDGSGGGPSDLRMRQATLNLLADMGAQPVTPESDLVLSSASADLQPPTSTITAPSNGTSTPQGTAISIAGTAADLGGGIVAGVEVSTDGGATWQPATGTSSWTYTWEPGAIGSAQILSRAFDDSGNVEIPGAGVSVTVTAPSCPCSLWSDAVTPGVPDSGPDNAVELGVKFSSDTNGYVTAVRFYKGVGNTGTHVGNLWTSTGTLLGSVTFAGETASGWQTALFATPIAITAGSTYIVSYHTSVGHYAADDDYFATTAVNSGPLHAPAAATTPNGVYHYGSASGFPSETYLASNYWVDLVFSPSDAAADTQPPSSSISSPVSGASVPQGSPVAVTGTASDTGGGIVTSVEVSSDGGATWQTAAGTTNWSLTWTPSLTGTVVLQSRAHDSSGNVETPGAGVSVTVSEPTSSGGGTCPCSLWDASSAPALPDGGPDNPVELGVKFSSDTPGYITALRFYKSTGNTGTHVGSLWTSTGTRLANVTFVAESASGWQTATLPSPVAISAGVTYIASYHTDAGHYAFDDEYFASGLDRAPLHAPAGTTTPNGVFAYGPAGTFPTSGYQDGNYWVDVVFNTTASDTSAPQLVSTQPTAGAADGSATSPITASFNEPLDPATVTGSTFEVRAADASLVSGSVAYDATAQRAVFTPTTPLAYSAGYSVLIRGGASSPHVTDVAGNPLASDYSWTFTTSAPPPPPPDQGPGGPILVVAGTSNPFGRYYSEILRNEGLNEFAVMDLSAVDASVLSSYDVVVLGETALTSSQASMFSAWVNGGGHLVAMRPDKQLASLLGLSSTSNTLSDQYLLINTASGPGAGLVSQTIQFHGTADIYGLAGASALATLYSSATTATSAPAVTVKSVGTNGGQAAAFAYDLARSVVYTRQGNPAWAGQERDGTSPIRSDDLFYGGTQRDWVDLNKVAIPQADEQQRLFANLILQMNMGRRPLPRFWYLPRGLKAAVIMSGDDHANGGTPGRWDRYIAASPAGCSVDDWQCVRATSYIFPNTPVTDAQMAPYQSLGFEIGLHLNTGCADFTPDSLSTMWTDQLAQWHANFPSLSGPVTNRTHCIVWSDWATSPIVELANGVRLDTNYYYWPDTWVQDRPGMFTGSGMPMRFANTDGTMIDVYQATTQLTDESGQSYPAHIDALLDNALGANGYYGVFTANMHTDTVDSAGSDAIVASAQSRGVPIVSARQMLTWLDGRNGSAFQDVSWSGSALTFSIAVGQGARGLTAMIPASVLGATISTLTADGAPVAFTQQTIKGITYAVFQAATAAYVATYSAGTPETTITSAPAGLTSSRSATFAFTSTIPGSTFQCSLDGASYASCASGLSYTGLADGSHTFLVRAVASGVTDPSPASASWTVDATPPTIASIVATPTTNSAAITWTTNEAADSVVDYGLSSSSLTSRVSSATMTTSHSLSLTGLASGTTYYYRITSRDAAGNATSAPSPSTASSFNTTAVIVTATQTPAAVAVQAGSVRSGSAASLSANDGATFSVNSNGSRSQTAAWYGSFTSVPSTLSNLSVTYSGSNSRSVTQYVEIWRWTTGQWVTLDSRTVGSEVLISGLTPSGSPAGYVSSSGEVRVRIRSVGSRWSFYSAGDFMQIRYDHP